MNELSHTEKIDRARQFVAKLDAIDGAPGGMSGNILADLGTIHAALSMGLQHPDTCGEYEALVMIEHMQNSLRERMAAR